MNRILWALVLPALATALQENVCGGNYTGSATIVSPGFPALYPNNKTCTWYLKASTGRSVYLVFTTFRLEENFDFLRVYAGGELVARLTGSSAPPPFSLPDNARLVFDSDATVRKKGFSVTFLSRVFSCGGFRQGSGIITSPSYPMQYPNNVDCTWTVLATAGKRLQVRFTTINIEKNHDYLKVYDGSRLSETYTGLYRSTQALTLGRTAILRFTSDLNGRGTGFRANITEVPMLRGTPAPSARLSKTEKDD